MFFYLISLVDANDAPKIEYIYRKYHRDMIRFAKFRLRKAKIASYEVDAEDVVQNAFVKISKHVKRISLDVSEKELKAYVFSIVANESNNFISDYIYVESLDEGHSELSDSDFFEGICIKERYNEVIGAIESMDERYSITLLYRYHNRMTVRQIAELMGIPEKTVYTRLMRGKSLLLKLLEETENG